MLSVSVNKAIFHFYLHLALIAKAGTWSDEIPEHVTVHNLKSGKIRKGILRLRNLILKLKPDTVFSTGKETNLATCLIKTFFLPKMYLVIREENAPSTSLPDKSKWPKIWRWLYRLFYPRANKIICLSKYISKDLQESFTIPAKKLMCIYNPLDIENIRRTAGRSPNPFAGMEEGPHVVAAGRYVNQKGFDLLIASFSKLLEHKKRAQLWILGEGPMESKYKKLRNLLEMNNCVHFAGFQNNIYAWFRHADLFILSSRYEGLPNVLLEAMACGCPVAVREHPGGTREIMELTNQQERMSAELDWRPDWFQRDSGEVINLMKKYYDVGVVVPQYSSILNGTY